MLRSRTNKINTLSQSCKRLFHKLGLAVALSTISGCPSVSTPLESSMASTPKVDVKPLTEQESLIIRSARSFCYCVLVDERAHRGTNNTNYVGCIVSSYSDAPLFFSKIPSNFEPKTDKCKSLVDDIRQHLLSRNNSQKFLPAKSSNKN